MQNDEINSNANILQQIEQLKEQIANMPTNLNESPISKELEKRLKTIETNVKNTDDKFTLKVKELELNLLK